MSSDMPIHDRRIADKRIEEIEGDLKENTLLTATNSRQIDAINTKVDKVHTAMFAPDSDNEFNTPGVMTTMKKLDAHLDVLCTWAKWGKRIVAFLGGIGMSLIVFAHQMGWL